MAAVASSAAESRPMQITHLRHDAERGWQPPLPVHLDSPQTLLMAFGARRPFADGMALRELRLAMPSSVLLGCSTAGEIGPDGVGDDGLSVVVARFEHTTLRTASVTLAADGDAEAAGRELAAALPAEGLRCVLALSCGVQVNGTALVRGLNAALAPGVSVSGGLAGDGDRFEETWTVAGIDDPAPRGVSAVGLYGSALRVGHGCDDGWTDFGPERLITGSQGHVLHTLDGQPALGLYKNYLGDVARELPGAALRFPLSVQVPGADGPVVRTILGIDDAAQTMTFAGDMPEGASARLMRTNTQQLVHSASAAAQHALDALGSLPTGAPVLALAVSCIGRRLIMGERTDEEVEAVAETLPPGSTIAGFYSYGEIAPNRGFTCADLHNQTMTVTMLAEG